MARNSNIASKSNIKAVVTITGKIDPSLTMAINKVSSQMNKLSTSTNKSIEKINRSITKINKAIQGTSKSFGGLGKSTSKTSNQITQLFNKANKSITNTNKSLGKVGKNASKVGKSKAGNQNSGIRNTPKIPNVISKLGGIIKSKTISGIGKLGGLIGSGVSKLSGSLISGIKKMGSVLGSSLISAGKQGIQLATDLQRVQKSVNSTFGGSSSEINNWAKSATKGFGLSELQAKQFSSSMGEVLKSTGLPSGNIVKMSENLTQLTGDFSSFYNISQDDAFKKIQAGISGDEGALKDMGINMSEANLQAYALSKGIKVSYNQMDEASKTQLRYNYLMNNTRNVQNDFSKDSGSFANQMTLLKTNYQQFITNLMSTAMPAIAKCLQLVNKFMDSIQNNPAIMQGIQSAITSLFNQIASALPGILNLVQSLLPILVELISGLLPLISPILSLIINTISTLAPPIIQIVTNLLPPIMQLMQAVIPLLQAVVPIIGTLANVIANILTAAIKFATPYIEKFINFISKGVSLVSKFGSFIGKVFGKSGKSIDLQANVSSNVSGFADGGIANHPSIFGEAGPEMAIPLQRTSRSIGLLNQTAQILGVQQGNGGPNVTINLTINSSDGNPRTIAGAAEDAIVGIIEKYFGDKARVAYGQ